jgi:uncharacterized protein (DUF58 family)
VGATSARRGNTVELALFSGAAFGATSIARGGVLLRAALAAILCWTAGFVAATEAAVAVASAAEPDDDGLDLSIHSTLVITATAQVRAIRKPGRMVLSISCCFRFIIMLFL